MNKSSVKEVDENEVLKAINKLKIYRSPGPEQLTNEIIKLAAPIIAPALSYLFNLVLETSEVPKQWTESNIILLYKKGNPNDIGNYRPISLMSNIYKLFSSILEKRISEKLENNQPPEQAGFRKGFSTIDHIHTLEQIIEKHLEFNNELYIAFIDYTKAFDSISHLAIWESLNENYIEKTYIDVLKNIYTRSMSRVQLERTGPEIQIERGVRQGDPISPKLFISVLETIIGKLKWDKEGIYINGKYLHHLRFADDIVLLAKNSSNLEKQIHALHEASKEVGLIMNLTKTKIMTNGRRIPIEIDESPLEYVDNYIYLGKRVSLSPNHDEEEVDRRIKITWKKFWHLQEIFKSDLPVKYKKKVMDSCLLPTLTYACQTWKMTNKIKTKIKTCQRAIERNIMKIKKFKEYRTKK